MKISIIALFLIAMLSLVAGQGNPTDVDVIVNFGEIGQGPSPPVYVVDPCKAKGHQKLKEAEARTSGGVFGKLFSSFGQIADGFFK